jgi:hypothetical protein
MPPMQEPSDLRTRTLTMVALFSVSLILLFSSRTWAQAYDMHDMPGMSLNTPAAPEDPTKAAKRLADKQESEFNHHLTGIFVLFAGIFIFAGTNVAQRWPFVRYAWPMCFLAAGLFVLIFSDTEMWPFGPQTPWYAITHEAEDLQHKAFSIILLALGYVELQRARGRLKAPWAAWFFPAAGTAGALLLLFHVHSGDMQAPNAMETMERIQTQHRWLATAGLGVALANGLAEMPQKWQQFFRRVWPASLIILGVLLIRYTE